MSTSVFALFDGSESTRVHRLTAIGAQTLGRQLGREPSDVELLNVRRKARVIEKHEIALENAAIKAQETAEYEALQNRMTSGITVALPEEKLENRFVVPDDWVMVAPKGEFPHPKKLVQVLDDKSIADMANNFKKAKETDPSYSLLVDYDHKTQTDGGPASAWVTDLKNDDRGLMAKLAWSDSGRKAIANGEYRYFSPVWKRADCVDLPDDGSGMPRCRPTVLDSIAITNTPNIHAMPPITKIVQ